MTEIAVEFQQPHWCSEVREEGDRSIRVQLLNFRTLIDQVKKSASPAVDAIDQIRQTIHALEHLHVDAPSLAKSKILYPHFGLQRLFAFPESQRYPFDVRMDAKGLFVKWRRMDLDPDIMRGITEVKKPGGRQSAS